jgi:hypothetical protein
MPTITRLLRVQTCSTSDSGALLADCVFDDAINLTNATGLSQRSASERSCCVHSAQQRTEHHHHCSASATTIARSGMLYPAASMSWSAMTSGLRLSGGSCSKQLKSALVTMGSTNHKCALCCCGCPAEALALMTLLLLLLMLQVVLLLLPVLLLSTIAQAEALVQS